MFLGSQPLPRALILKCDIISGCFSVGETSSKLNKSKFTRLMLKTLKKPVIVVRAAASADPTHRQGVKWWQEEQRGEKLAQDQVHLTDFLAGCFILCDTPLCSKYVPVNQIILYWMKFSPVGRDFIKSCLKAEPKILLGDFSRTTPWRPVTGLQLSFIRRRKRDVQPVEPLNAICDLFIFLNFILQDIFLLRFRIALTRKSWPRQKHNKFHIKEQTTDSKQTTWNIT